MSECYLHGHYGGGTCPRCEYTRDQEHEREQREAETRRLEDAIHGAADAQREAVDAQRASIENADAIRAEAKWRKVKVLMTTGQDLEAIDHLLEAIHLDPVRADLRSALCVAQWKSGQQPAALSSAEVASRLTQATGSALDPIFLTVLPIVDAAGDVALRSRIIATLADALCKQERWLRLAVGHATFAGLTQKVREQLTAALGRFDGALRQREADAASAHQEQLRRDAELRMRDEERRLAGLEQARRERGIGHRLSALLGGAWELASDTVPRWFLGCAVLCVSAYLPFGYGWDSDTWKGAAVCNVIGVILLPPLDDVSQDQNILQRVFGLALFASLGPIFGMAFVPFRTIAAFARGRLD